MTSEAKRRLVETEAVKPKPAPTYKFRFERDGIMWGITEDGHYRVIDAGVVRPGVRVGFTIPVLRERGRRGTVVALIAGYGSPPPVVVVVRLDAVIPKDPEFDGKPIWPVRHYGLDDLEVVS